MLTLPDALGHPVTSQSGPEHQKSPFASTPPLSGSHSCLWTCGCPWAPSKSESNPCQEGLALTSRLLTFLFPSAYSLLCWLPLHNTFLPPAPRNDLCCSNALRTTTTSTTGCL